HAATGNELHRRLFQSRADNTSQRLRLEQMMSRLHASVISLFIYWSVGMSAVAASCRDPDVARNFGNLAFAAAPDATIEYFGHNFFQITSNRGTKIITDPIAPGMYPTPAVTPHVVTVGREHPNHNYVELAKGNPV